MTLDKDKLIEAMAQAIWQANPQKGAEWRELLILNDTDGYSHAKSTVEITRKQAKAALEAVFDKIAPS